MRPRQARRSHGSASSWSANTYSTAAMCLHGFSQSGQLHSVRRSVHGRGNRATPASREDRLELGRHLAGEQPGDEADLGRHGRVDRSHCAAVGAGSSTVTR